MENSPSRVHRAVLLGAVALVTASVGCSRGELSAAERKRGAEEAGRTAIPETAQTPVPTDSEALIDLSASQAQTKAPSSIEDILKKSPLRSAKADCATPVSGAAPSASEVGTQCPTDPPPKK